MADDLKKDLWRGVVKLHQAKGMTRPDAVKWVIIEWLLNGYVEPLIEATRPGGELDDPLLGVIALMLLRDPTLDYCLTVKPPPDWRSQEAGPCMARLFHGFDL